MKKLLYIMCILSALSLTACVTTQANTGKKQTTKQQSSYFGTNVGVGFVTF